MPLPANTILRATEFSPDQMAAVFACRAGPAGHYTQMHDRWFATADVPEDADFDFKRMFACVEADIDTHEPRLAKALEDYPNNLSMTTAVLMQCRGHHITTAHVGDSRGSVFIYDTREHRFRGFTLTHDHDASNKAEKKRVLAHPAAFLAEEKDGFEQNITDANGNVHGQFLAVSRALGNRAFEDWLLSTPQVTRFDLRKKPFYLRDHEIAFAVLDTDGVHMSMGTDQRTALLNHSFAKGDIVAPLTLAEHFGQVAIDNFSHDNMTCVVSQVGPVNHVTGILDGCGDTGNIAAHAAMELFLREIKDSRPVMRLHSRVLRGASGLLRPNPLPPQY